MAIDGHVFFPKTFRRPEGDVRIPEQSEQGGPAAAHHGGEGPLPEEPQLYTSLPRISVELWLTGGRPLTVTAAEESTPMLSFTPETSVGYVTLISDELEKDTTYYLVSGSARIGLSPV